MDSVSSADIFLFEGFRFDRRGGGLFHLDGRTPVTIGSRALDVLGTLIEHAGDLVSKDEIMETVWPGTVVEDGNLTVQISTLRRVLDQGRTEGSCIQTVAGRGYRFVVAVTRHKADALSADAVATLARSTTPATSRPTISVYTRRLVGAIALAALLVIAGGLWWLSSSQNGPSTAVTAPRLSIVVLPFANISDDRDQQYFADGVTEDLTTDLSKIVGMLVISRNSAFTYKDKSVDAKQVGRELGVRYVLEGSVRRSGNEVRINAQLINAENNAHLWAERFERDIGDLFALQNEITGRIAIALALAVIRVEAARPTDNPAALDYIFRGRAARLKPASPDSYAEAIGFFERALALDPQSFRAQAGLANALTGRVLDGMSASVAADIARAEGLVGQALALAPGNAHPHLAKGDLLRAQGRFLSMQSRFDEAVIEYETVLAFDHNAIGALGGIAQCKVFSGSIEEAIPLVEKAIRLSPRDPGIFFYYFQIARIHLLQSRTDEAIIWLEKARSANLAHPFIRSYLASAYGLKGESERAAAELAEARRLSIDGRFASISQVQAAGVWGPPKIRALFEATYFAGLRKAGMPEE